MRKFNYNHHAFRMNSRSTKTGMFSEWDKPHLFCNSNHKEVNNQMYDSTSMQGHTAHHAHIYEIMTFQISLMHHGDSSIFWTPRVNYGAGGHEKLSW